MTSFRFVQLPPIFTLCLLSVATLVTGCGDIEIPDIDLTGKEDTESTKAPAADGATESASTAVQQTPNVAVPTMSPQQIIDGIVSRPSFEITDADLKRIASLEFGLDQVQEFDLKSATVTGEGLAALSALPNLQKLDITALRLTDHNWQALGTLTPLRTLTAARTGFKDPVLESIGKLTGLTHLDVSETFLTDAGFQSLVNLSALEYLNISGVDMDGSCLQAFGPKGSRAPLKSIEASGGGFGYQGFVHVADFPQLESLKCGGASVTDASLEGLRGLKQLKVLHLTGNLLTDAGMPELGKLTSLEDLVLRDNRGISDRGLAKLTRLKALRTLDLENTSCSLGGAQQLKAALPECSIRIQQQQL